MRDSDATRATRRRSPSSSLQPAIRAAKHVIALVPRTADRRAPSLAILEDLAHRYEYARPAALESGGSIVEWLVGALTRAVEVDDVLRTMRAPGVPDLGHHLPFGV